MLMEQKMKHKIVHFFIIGLLALSLAVYGCAPQKGIGTDDGTGDSDNTDDGNKIIDSFDACVAAGNPVMESYPERCNADGKTFVRPISMDISDALVIAEKSECVEKGSLTQDRFYNDYTDTWWINLDMKEEFAKKGCSPACVIDAVTREAEINWRCTGLIQEVPPKDGSGSLVGKISIGPICPVETYPPRPECLPKRETFDAYALAVYSVDKSEKIADIIPVLDGSFSLDLEDGDYVIDFKEARRGLGGGNLPADVSIRSGETTNFNIDIDTGIR
jgi:hypothetical protein